MRRTFADVLKERKIDIKSEYNKLYSMMYNKVFDEGDISLHDIIGESFPHFYFRGTCLSIEEFDEKYNFRFEENPENFNIEYLVAFCEYFQNMLMGLQTAQYSSRIYNQDINTMFIQEQLRLVIDGIGYMPANDNGLTIYVEKSPAAISVAESQEIPREMSYKVLEYNHHSMRGNLNRKKQTLLQIAALFEPKREEFKKIDPSLCSDMFFAFNNLNLRHNNIDPAVPGKYKPTVASMKKEELERWYDEVYQMCLLAFMELEEAERKPKFKELKDAIEGGHSS